MKPELLERYLDGLGSPAERAAFERELARDPELAAEVELQRRIDAALGRRFAPPASLSAPLPAAARAGGGRRVAAVAAAAVALLGGLALGLATLRGGGGGGEQVARLPEAPGQQRADGAGGALAPAAVPAAVEPRGAAPAALPWTGPMPDVASLYQRLSASCGEPGLATAVDLSSELAQRFDACFDVGAPACSLLGPYAAPEWPSATVLVGYCDEQGRTPSLLVVDDQTMRGCGLAPDTGGQLLPFYKEVNGVAVWEISPHAEPLLLNAVRSCGD